MPLAMTLSLYNHHTDGFYEKLVAGGVLDRARRLARLAREKGLGALDASDPLVAIGMEVDAEGRVTKNSLGMLDLSWQAAERPGWAAMILREVEQIRAAVREAHGVEIRHLIWAGMGGSAEDKHMYSGLGLLDGGVRTWVLDSTDPNKLGSILARMAPGGLPARALAQTLVVGMAMGMTSYEPVLNLEKLSLLYRKCRVAPEANFLYMTLPGSLLDQFAGRRGFRRVELQPDSQNTTAGRHSGPLTRGSLYPLALNGVDLEAWIEAAVLSEEEIHSAFRMAAFLHGNGVEGRDKVTLLLPRQLRGAGTWTKQDFEESLGKSEQLGIKIFPAAAVEPPPLDAVRHPAQDRVFWAIGPEPAGFGKLRRQGHPCALLTLSRSAPVSKYMQWVHYVVFGLGWLRQMNFVTQPGVELYKEIANRLHTQARKTGRVERTPEWRALVSNRQRAAAAGEITLHYDSLVSAGLVTAEGMVSPRQGAAAILAGVVRKLRSAGKIEYAELTFFGDTRYSPEGRRLRRLLDSAAAAVFGERLGLSSDVYEGPAMNHSYHEMIIGHGRCFSVILRARRQSSLGSIGYRPEYHQAQWLATKMALERRGRAVVALTFPDLGPASLKALGAFFREVGEELGGG